MAELSRIGLLDGQSTSKLQFCEHYVFRKKKRDKFSKDIRKMKGVLDYLYFDISGLLKVPCKGGASYMLMIIDDFSRKV